MNWNEKLIVCEAYMYMCRYITSDCDAVATVYEYQKYAKTATDAVADVLQAGSYKWSLFHVLL